MARASSISAVFPTPVGVFPKAGKSKFQLRWSSPRPWGCFVKIAASFYPSGVFPTPVGVFLSNCFPPNHAGCLPHARGGVSSVGSSGQKPFQSSPRPWGCFKNVEKTLTKQKVFPTPVGVFLKIAASFYPSGCLPHARGGVSTGQDGGSYPSLSSPRPWGCFGQAGTGLTAFAVFPTPVGVFLDGQKGPPRTSRLPHARGGVSRVIR